MPELPEVEVIRMEMEKLVKGKTFAGVEVFFPGTVAHPDIERFSAEIKGKTINLLSRRGKFLIFNLSESKRLIIHLRMTGSLVFNDSKELTGSEKHCRLVFSFKEGGFLSYSDMRKFGRIWLIKENEEEKTGLQRLGPDWLTEANKANFRQRLQKRPKASVKGVLLDQSILAGLGNIYVDESLHRAGIHPATKVGLLNDSQIDILFKAIKEVLKEGIKRGGTTIRDYRNASGEPGGFQAKLRVYGRKGGECLLCGTKIEKTVTCGRGTYFCPSCQTCHQQNM